jgi:hypothetical protein
MTICSNIRGLVGYVPLPAEPLREGVKMAKEIILCNLAEHAGDEQCLDFVTNEKDLVLESLPSVKNYELVRTKGVLTDKTPFLFG